MLLSEANECFGGLDVVVQCAGVTAFRRFEEIPPEASDTVVRTNLVGSPTRSG
jgi:NAD(P)-dependent dehydrogenase (short-subunit alcohol dehydrogenase family)